jgi:hypothetical protein
MTFEEFKQAVRDNAAKVETAVQAVFSAHPEIEAQLATDATTAVGALKSAAETEVEHVAPAEATTLDTLISAAASKIDDDLAADIAAANAKADAKRAALATLQGAST